VIIKNHNKSKIIIIGPAYPLRGGIANFNEAMCRALIEAGHEVEIVSFTLQYPGFLFPGKTQKAEGDQHPRGIKVTSLINSVNPLSWFKAASYISKQNPDKVIIRYWLPFMGPCLGTIARLIKRKNKKTEIIGLCDNVIPHESRPGDFAFTKYFTGGCDSFVVMSQSVLEDLRKFDQVKPVKLKPHPVYDIFGEPVSKFEARKTLQLKQDARYVLFFGFIRKYKGLDLLLRAFADERVRRAGVKLIVAGEFYEDKKPYLDLIDSLGLKDAVLLHDHYIPKEAVRHYFCAADLIAQPYRDATQSGVTQIAYHFSKPMLVTNVGGLPEIVPHGEAGFVTDTTPESIASAIAAFYEKYLEESLTAGVKRKAKDFSWEEFVKVMD
jgi:glycosyltransferase involved in cell wall biosynthesis